MGVNVHLQLDAHGASWRPADPPPVSLSRGAPHIRDAAFDAETQRRLAEIDAQGEHNEIDLVLNNAGVPRGGLRGPLSQVERVRVLAAWAKGRR